MKNPVAINKQFYTMASVDNDSAEITMYGTIVESKPKDFWTGKEIEGNFIVADEFLKDLEEVKKCSSLTIRMNSIGGDAGVSIMIHNRLRELSESGTKLTCIVDGVAMSGGSLIMCACDTVRVNPSSLIMIHKCWAELWGGYNADDLRKEAEAYDAYDKAQASIYKRKCKLSETVILHMMADTTYMTGKEAVEKGFADELIEDAEPLNLAASADGRNIFVRGKEVHLTYGMFAPDFIPTINPEASAPEEIKQTAVTVREKGGNPMTVNELRENYPDLIGQIESEARASVNSEQMIGERVLAERQRIKEIDGIAGLYDDATVAEAKYGETACSAQELAYRAAKAQAAKGKNVLAGMAVDANASGAANVGAVPAEPEAPQEKTEDEKFAEARSIVKALLGKKKEA